MRLAMNAISIEALDGQVNICQEQRETGKSMTIILTAEQVQYVCDLLRRVIQPVTQVMNDKPYLADDETSVSDDKLSEASHKPLMEWASK